MKQNTVFTIKNHITLLPLFILLTIPTTTLFTSIKAQAKNIIINRDQQTQLSVTLVPKGLNKDTISLIEDNRHLNKANKGDIVNIQNLSSQLQADSLNITHQQNTQQFTIKAQDNTNPYSSLNRELESYLGKEVTLISIIHGKGIVKNTVILLKVIDTIAVIKHENIIKSISLIDPNISISLPSKSSNLSIISNQKPRVSFKSLERFDDSDIKISYISTGLEWHTDYILELNNNSQHSSLKGFVSITNKTETTFSNSHITLLADAIINNSENSKNLVNLINQQKQLRSNDKTLKLANKITLAPSQTTKIPIFNISRLPTNSYYQYHTAIHSGNRRKNNMNLNDKRNVYPNFNVALLNSTKVFLPKKSSISIYKANSKNISNIITSGVFNKSRNENNKILSIANSQSINIQQKQTSYRKTYDGEIIGIQFKINNTSNFNQKIELTNQYEHPAKIISSTFPLNSQSDIMKSWLFPIQGNSTTIFNLQVRLFTKR